MSSPRPELLVAPCSYQAAKYAVEKWHYSRSMPPPPVVRFGAWEGGAFIGAILFSRGANKNLGSFAGLSAIEVCELTRVALTGHTWPVSRILALSIKHLKAKEKGLRLIVSYADTNRSHIGAIYQAANWVYAGETSKSYLYKDRRGRVWHQRQVSASGVKLQYGELRTAPRIDECEKIPQLGKHRYLMALDAAMRRQIAPLAQPYPKKDMRPVNGDDLASSEAGRFNSEPDALACEN